MERNLIDARVIAERAHKAQTAFLTAASHDLRQPVQALELLNGALRRSVQDPLVHEIVETQQHALEAMTNLLNSLLDIGRLDAGAIEPEVEEFPMQRLIDRLSSEFSRQATHKGLAFRADNCPLVVRSDPNLLDEIIQNLVSNAIRYTGQGEVRLTCREQCDQLSIDISDTGIGIEADQVENIFREFLQVHNAEAEKVGFGLGLAIVQRLADLLGHRITVESEPGHGSRFSVIVPLVRDSSGTSSCASDTSPGSGCF
jgi:signal transduction histidine kinase